MTHICAITDQGTPSYHLYILQITLGSKNGMHKYTGAFTWPADMPDCYRHYKASQQAEMRCKCEAVCPCGDAMMMQRGAWRFSDENMDCLLQGRDRASGVSPFCFAVRLVSG